MDQHDSLLLLLCFLLEMFSTTYRPCDLEPPDALELDQHVSLLLLFLLVCPLQFIILATLSSNFRVNFLMMVFQWVLWCWVRSLVRFLEVSCQRFSQHGPFKFFFCFWHGFELRISIKCPIVCKTRWMLYVWTSEWWQAVWILARMGHIGKSVIAAKSIVSAAEYDTYWWKARQSNPKLWFCRTW